LLQTKFENTSYIAQQIVKIGRLPKGREREGEKERMDSYFCVAPLQKILTAKNGAKTLQV
jgi:hypothetical protein